MRKYIFFIFLIFLFGCKTEKIEENNHFLDKYLPKLEEYILSDQKLSSRDKNTFLTEFNEIMINRYKNQNKDNQNECRVNK